MLGSQLLLVTLFWANSYRVCVCVCTRQTHYSHETVPTARWCPFIVCKLYAILSRTPRIWHMIVSIFYLVKEEISHFHARLEPNKWIPVCSSVCGEYQLTHCTRTLFLIKPFRLSLSVRRWFSWFARRARAGRRWKHYYFNFPQSSPNLDTINSFSGFWIQLKWR